MTRSARARAAATRCNDHAIGLRRAARAAEATDPAKAAELLDLADRWTATAVEWTDLAVAERAREPRCWCGRTVSTLPDGDTIHCAEHDLPALV